MEEMSFNNMFSDLEKYILAVVGLSVETLIFGVGLW